MGRHGPVKPLWPSILGLVATAMCLAALLILIINYPQWKP